MSLRTCSWLLPQNEQRYGTLLPLLLPVVLTTVRSALRLLRFCELGLGAALGHVRVRHARPLAADEAGVVGLGDQRGALEAVHGIDDAIDLCLVGRHEPVPLRVAGDRLDILAGVAGQDLVVEVDEGLPLL